ncbi:hypothetical protein [Pseudomonas mangrovi]|uniref:Uncharacterized protein n=1 Tax=Pseudomonas mangrovi TaxID=2161748 RepID=A0A2T5P9F9_9PSED|nr:hypothetical protein [Pseudomonas mangrovi]PTU74379.1 hypothetical protein DBO85_09800 [Pseudomonas mangrovi]
MPHPFALKNTHSAPELAIAFDQGFDPGNPLLHIHGALLALCNPGFDKPRTRAAIQKPVLDLSLLQARFSNIELFFRNALAEGAISFRPDTPIHGNDEGRYEGGSQRDRIDQRARHFEFGAVGGGMRVVFDADLEEIYISAHYSYPARLTAAPGSAQEDWLLTTKARFCRECWVMADHSAGVTRQQSDEAGRLRELSSEAKQKGLGQTAVDGERRANQLADSLHLRAVRNRAFNAWLYDPKSNMTPELRKQIYGLGS